MKKKKKLETVSGSSLPVVSFLTLHPPHSYFIGSGFCFAVLLSPKQQGQPATSGNQPQNIPLVQRGRPSTHRLMEKAGFYQSQDFPRPLYALIPCLGWDGVVLCYISECPQPAALPQPFSAPFPPEHDPTKGQCWQPEEGRIIAILLGWEPWLCSLFTVVGATKSGSAMSSPRSYTDPCGASR